MPDANQTEPSWRERLVAEHQQLTARVGKLAAFVASEEAKALATVEQLDLREQLQHMHAYLGVLGRRISRLI